MIFEILPPAVLWGATVLRLPTLLRDRRQRAMWACLCAGSVAETFTFPAVARATGRPILIHLLVVVSAFLLLRFLAVLTGRGVPRGQWALTGTVLAALVALDAVAGGIGPSPDRPDDAAAATVAFWVVREGYLVAVLTGGIVLFWSVARTAPAGLPRLGLRTIAAGWALIALSAAAALPLLLGAGGLTAPARHLAGAGTLLAVGGALVPAGRRARVVLAEYRSLLALRPLWTAVRDAFPEVVLFSPRRAVVELAGVDDVRLRLYRRVIEIRDGMLALRPYVHGVLPETPEAEAAAIAEALRRRAEGAPPSGSSPGFAMVGPEMADEVAWLSRVSRAYRRIEVTPAAAAPTPRSSGSAR
ncbi:MAB_1171c family putative transporter [Actinoplanes subtropicus]|uniref:MAB_1171c family putative transporter n=1 Tax=Actinoplanes subtropicus TaxID=543632 RepID=UPI0004C2C5DA|nr:MAB_1171c family putative transporter [Actinoplanes subtropicus]